MKKFRRENRYIVIKRSDLAECQPDSVKRFEIMLKHLGLPRRCYVVVESDWPEYDIVWGMIENRVNNEYYGKCEELAANIIFEATGVSWNRADTEVQKVALKAAEILLENEDKKK